MSSEEQKPTTNTNDTGSQSGSAAVQRGGAGTESTPADSDTPKQDSSLVCNVKIYSLLILVQVPGRFTVTYADMFL